MIFLVALLLLFHPMHVLSEFICNDDTDCLPNGRCNAELKCLCSIGYTGPMCETDCPIRCQNGGQCQIMNEHAGFAEHDEYTCDCPSAFPGALCQGAGGDATSSSSSGSTGGSDNKKALRVGVSLALTLLVLSVVFLGLKRKRSKQATPKDSETEKEVDVELVGSKKEDTDDLPSVT